MFLNCGVGEDSWESHGLEGDPTSPSKGDQSWVFIGRTEVEAETPILWPPDAKSWLIWKDPDAGKDWGQEEKGTTEDEMVRWITDLMDMGLVDSGSWWWTGRPGMLWFMGSQRVGHDWVTELNWSELRCKLLLIPPTDYQCERWRVTPIFQCWPWSYWRSNSLHGKRLIQFWT